MATSQSSEPTERGRKLFDFIDNNDIEKTKLLLVSHDVDFSLRIKGDCPIHMAARKARTDIIRELLEHGDNNMNTPLHYAAREGFRDTVKLLMERKANVKVQNHDGDTPLHMAVLSQSLDFIELLISLGMNPNHQNRNGQTPLHVAVSNSRQEAMEALLMHKANTSIKDKRGRTPKDVAKKSLAIQLRKYNNFLAAKESGIIMAQGMDVNPKKTSTVTMKRLGVTLTSIFSQEIFPFQLYCRREKAENSDVSFPTETSEEIVSDVFNFRLTDSRSPVSFKADIPLFTPVGVKEEAFLRFLDGRCLETDNQHQKGFCSINLELLTDTDEVFVVFTRPKIEVKVVDQTEAILTSTVQEEFKMKIPENSFKTETKLSCTIYDNIEPDEKRRRMDDVNLLTDVYQINVDGKQPEREVEIQFPIKNVDPSDEIVIITADENSMKDETSLEIVPATPRLENDNIFFTVQHFCIHVAIPKSLFLEKPKEVYEQIVSSRNRKKAASFLIMTLEQSSSDTIAVVEVTAAKKIKSRIEHWQKKGYEKHDNEPDAHMLEPCQKLKISFTGNVALTDADSDDKPLVFLPRRASYKPFRLALADPDKPPTASAEISAVVDNSSEESEKLEALQFVMPIPPPPVDISKPNKFDPENSDIKKPLLIYLRQKFIKSPLMDEKDEELTKTIENLMAERKVTKTPSIIIKKTKTFARNILAAWREKTFKMLVDNTEQDTAAMSLEDLCDHVLGDFTENQDCMALVVAMRYCAEKTDAFIISTTGVPRPSAKKESPVFSSLFWRELGNLLKSEDFSKKSVLKKYLDVENGRIKRYVEKYGGSEQ